MAIIVDNNTRLLVQGVTGNQGRFHCQQMVEYGTPVVAGVSPGKGGQSVAGVPVYETVAEAVDAEGANTSVVFVPAPFVKDAVLEAISAGISTVIIISEGVPLLDTVHMLSFARSRGATVVGPNSFGVITPGQAKVGIPPNSIFKPGPVGVVARSGTLAYEIVYRLGKSGFGQSTVMGMGGDRIVGLTFSEILARLESDRQTKAIVMIGEIGGGAEEEAAEFIGRAVSKPVVAFLAGRKAPAGKRMGHAGAIIERGKGTMDSKIRALKAAGVAVSTTLVGVPELIADVLKK